MSPIHHPFIFLWLLVPPLLVLIGFLTLVLLGWTRRRRPGAEPTTRRAIRIAAITACVVGVYLLVATASGYLSVITWIIPTVILVSAWMEYWRHETRRLVMVLAVASERGIPIEAAVSSFADESHGLFAASARRLGDYLSAGIPLSVALQRAWLGASPELLLAADMGERTGTLGPSLRRMLAQLDALDVLLRSVWEKLFYIGMIACWGLAIVVFMMIKIVPIFQEMFEEFEVHLPGATFLVIELARFMAEYWYLLLLMLLPCGFLLLLGGVAYVGIPIRSLPVLRRFTGSVDDATMMRLLSVSVRHQLPLNETLYLLAGFTPLSRARARLARAAGRVAQGVPWPDALQRERLIRKSERGVFQAAERVGNLAWALNEMAESRLRRSARRFRAVTNLVLPLLVAGCGMCVMLISVGMLAPLFKLIAALG